MKTNYDFSKLKRKVRTKKVDVETATRTAISIKIESETLGGIKEEAVRLGVPYQTLIKSILYRYANRELIDRKYIEFLKIG